MNQKLFTLIIFALISFSLIAAPNVSELNKLADEFKLKREKQKQEAIEFAKKNNLPLRKEDGKGGVLEIQYIDKYGKPQYYTTNNADAAETISANTVYPGGGAGYNLTGSGITLNEWDGGGVLTSHIEFGGRVIQVDSPSSTHYHSTHVAGTMIASGVNPDARGMSYSANLRAFDWDNDDSELASEGANGAIISNHSYGYVRGWRYDQGTSTWSWYGNSAISSTEDYLFGFYDSESQGWDQIAYNAPDFLICKSSGNDRNDTGDGSYPQDGNQGAGYDCIGQRGVAKNVLTVGAVYDISGGYTQPSDVSSTAFSSWGPADDGRIKPDVVANGYTLTSCDDTGDTDYLTISGTSMSTPSVAGALGLLQELYDNLHNTYMKASTLKGLVIHTADEAGSSDGPDYQNGWGLVNIRTAADLIAIDDISGRIFENSLANGETYEIILNSNGTEPIKATICWTDIPGTPVSASLDPTDKMLVNDLDLRIQGTSTHYPWKLDGQNPSSAATNNSDNDVDNVEVVSINNPASGQYTLRVSHKGFLANPQDYALIISGASVTTITPVASVNPDYIMENIAPDNTSQAALTISNTGNSDMDYSIIVDDNISTRSAYTPIFDNTVISKGQTDTRQGTFAGMPFNHTRSTARAAGGPDNYGYTWKDESETGGPAYSWVDIETTGTEVTSWTATGSYNALDEGYAGPFSLGFDFNYYGNIYNTIYINSNGLISFEQSGVDLNAWTNSDIPNSADPNNIVIPFWDDMNGVNGGSVYIKQNTDSFIVQFEDWHFYSPSSNSGTWQAIIYHNGKIQFNYESFTSDPASCTAGIESPDGSDGLPIVYNSTYLTGGKSILIDPPGVDWLSLDNSAGTISPSGNNVINITFDSSGMDYGTYEASINITTNDPNNRLISVPVTLIVERALSEPQNLTATLSGETNVVLDWDAPNFTESDLRYDNGVSSGGIGASGGAAADFDVAIRFTTADLVQYDGAVLNEVSFFPRYDGSEYYIRVWVGGTVSGTPDAGTLIVNQMVNPSTYNAWNRFTLNSPVIISDNQELWIGYRVNTPADYPAGRDSGPAVDYKGDMVYWGGNWISLHTEYPTLDYNWNIIGHTTLHGVSSRLSNTPVAETPRTITSSVIGDNPLPIPLLQDRSLSGYNIYRDNNLIQFVDNSTSYTDPNLAEGTYTYYVTAVHTEGESGPSNTVQAQIIIVPDSPQVIGIAIQNNAVNILWVDNGSDGYYVYAGDTMDNITQNVTGTGSITTYNNLVVWSTPLNGDNKKFYTVVAVNNSGTQVRSLDVIQKPELDKQEVKRIEK